MKYFPLFEKFGLAKNEAIIYETLLHEGESNVANISVKSKIHRRNVYDSLNRLIEKGLAFEILQSRENIYKAVDPDKFSQMLAEKQKELDKIMPQLKNIYQNKPHNQEVYIYKGLEGYKNYMRDILRLGQDDYILGGKGLWADPKIISYTEQFMKEAKKLGIKFHIIYDEEVKKSKHKIASFIGGNYRFLPEKYFTNCSMEIFADRVVILSDIGRHGEMDESSIHTVIINQQVADAMRTWWKALWSIAKE